jgi:hypothetical protein
MAGDINVVIQHTQAALAEAHVIAGTQNPAQEIAQLKLDLATRTQERDVLQVKLADAIVLVGDLTTADAAEDAKRAALLTKLQQ